MGQSEKLVLVGVVNRKKDLEIARKEHWYRIPQKHLPKRKAKYLALYQTRVFDKEGKAINYYASIKGSSLHQRSELLPDEKNHPRSEDYYYKFNLGSLRATPDRIENRYRRRINFAFTTLEELLGAKEISELFNIVPLEEMMRQALKNCKIKAIGEYSIMEKKRLRYRLDFAIFCQKGKINVECDDLRWHSQPKQRRADKKRDRWLKKQGWTVFRFSGEEIKNNAATCVKILKQTIQSLGRKKKVAIGGTFDVIHKGHKALLRKAYELGEVTIGLTSNILVRKIKRREVKDFKYRKKELEDFIRKEFKVKPKIVKIENKFGPTLKEDFDYIVVSPATYSTAVLINQERKKRKKKPLKIVKIEFVLDKDGKPLSATKILKKKIDKCRG